MVEDRIKRLLENISIESCGYITAPEDIFYFSGFTGEGCLIISHKNKILLTDGRYTEQARKQTKYYNIQNVLNHGKVLKELGLKVYFQSGHLTCSKFVGYKDQGVDLIPFDVDFKGIRSVKDEGELDKLRAAAKIGEKALNEVLNFIKIGKTEKEVAAYINYVMESNGAQKPSFDTICISGKNTSLPHGIPSDKPIQEGDFVTMDFGCIYGGYCSDMTRTVAVGNVSDEMEKVYDIVKQAGDNVQGFIKSSVSCADADKIARDYITKAGYGEYFVHSTGHGVGIQIHENPNLSPRSEQILQVNNVVTVEPGIYMPDKFGVRIENTVIVIENSCEILQSATKDLIIL